MKAVSLFLALACALCTQPTNSHALSAKLHVDKLMGTTIPFLKDNNEKAALGWGASYQMMAYVELFGAFGEAQYAERAVKLIDAVQAQRDDIRKVKDYRGKSAACWQNKHYQPNQEPYCYVVHSGMLTYPMARFIEHLARYPKMASSKAYDGKLYSAKAQTYLKQIKDTIAAHEDQWRSKGSSQGYYIFRNASFMKFGGDPMPLNQQNTLGRTLTTLARITKDARYTDKARRLCTYFKVFLKKQGRGYVWNYWPTTYKAPGEDISHAAINAAFAVECYRSQYRFTKSDIKSIAYTLFDLVYKDATSWTKFVGGGTVDATYAKQIGRWLSLAEAWPVIYGPIRTFYERTYASLKTAKTSTLYAFALLAVYEPPHIHHGYYHVDWSDKGSYKQATAYGANLLGKPHDPKTPALLKLTYASYDTTQHQQYDGKAYHTIQKLANTNGTKRTEWFVFDPALWHAYTKGNALFQFKDSKFASGKGIKVWEPTPLTPPTITSIPSKAGTIGNAYAYDNDKQASAKGSGPMRWFAVSPSGLQINPTTGKVTWTPTKSGSYKAEIGVQSDVGEVRQVWTILVPPPVVPEPPIEPQAEPTPEPQIEPTPEPTTEPSSEKRPEPTQEPVADAGQEPILTEPTSTPDTHTEPTTGTEPPATPDQAGRPDATTTNETNHKPDDNPSTTPDTTQSHPDTLSPSGCGCQQQPGPTGWLLAFLVCIIALTNTTRQRKPACCETKRS
jgi:hypothetical protein